MLHEGDGACPFKFNFDPTRFQIGDTVSYRVTGSLADFPFVGTLVAVEPDHVVVAADPEDRRTYMRGTRESRPIVEEATGLAATGGS